MDSSNRYTPQSQKQQPSGAGTRLRLMVVLLLCALLVALSLWWTKLRKPPLPANANTETQRTYWKQRIKTDVADTEAYVRLGSLEEKSGYYMSAVKYLKAARALGVADKEIVAPLGRALTHLAQYPDALTEMKKAIQLAPDSVELTANLAGLYVTAERPQGAEEVLKSFVKAHPKLNDSEMRRLMFCFLECGNNDLARSLAEQIVAILPQDLIAHSVIARCALAKSDAETSRRHLETVLETVKDDGGLYFLYGNTLDALGKKDEALLAWQKAIALNPQALDVYEQIGKAYWQKNDFAKAAVAFESLAQKAPSRVTTLRAANALERAGKANRAHYWKAVAAGFTGDFPHALAEAKQIENAPDPAMRTLALQATAEAYRGMRQRDNYLKTMLQLTAKNTLADLMLMAQAYAELDRFDKRKECLLQALQIATPQDKAPIYYQLGVVAQTRGVQDEAEKALDSAITADPKNPLYYRELADIYFSRRTIGGRLEKAIQAWEKAIALSQEEGSDWQHLGVAYLAQNQSLKAIAALEHAIDLEPGSGPAYLELSKAYRAMKDESTSQHFMQIYQTYVVSEQKRQTLRSRARRPNATAPQLVEYGDLMTQIGDLNEAQQQYERALLLTPKDDSLRKKLISLYDRLRMPDRRIQLEKGMTAQGATP